MSLVPVNKNIPYAVVTKQTDETITSDIVLHNDLELKAKLLIPNHSYQFKIILYILAPSSADIDYAYGIPSGTIRIPDGGQWSVNQVEQTQDGTTEVRINTAGSPFIDCVELHGKITITTTGDFNFKWAQGVSNVGDTKIFAGSSLVIYR